MKTAMVAEVGRRTKGPLGRFAVAVLSLLLGVIAFAAHPTEAHASTTTARAATFTYDFSAVARVYAHEFLSADASPAQFSVAKDGFASPTVEGRSTSMSPAAPVVATEAAGVAHPTFEPGPFAGESIPARSSSQSFNSGERASMNEFGADTGCHTCGTTNAGTKSGNFVPDHQPVSALNTGGLPQRLFPQCIVCSREQGLAVARWLKGMPG